MALAMNAWPNVENAIDALSVFEDLERDTSADHHEALRLAVIAVSQIYHQKPELRAVLDSILASPIEIVVVECMETGGPVRQDRFAIFCDTGKSVGERLWHVYETALDSFAKDWHARS
jgi:hypothetical protein